MTKADKLDYAKARYWMAVSAKDWAEARKWEQRLANISQSIAKKAI